MFNDYPDILTVEQLAELLHISRNSAYKLVRSNAIVTTKIGRQIRITKTALLAFLNAA